MSQSISLRRGLCVGVWTCAVVVTAAAVAFADPTSRTVYVTAMDKSGAELAALTPADFQLKEGGKARTITSVTPLATPLQVALVVENGLTGDNSVRVSMGHLIQHLNGRADVALITVSQRAVTNVDFTRDGNALIAGINQLGLYSPTQQDNLPEGLYDVAQLLTKRPEGRRVILTMAIDGQQASAMPAQQILDGIRDTGIVLYAITLPGRSISTDVGTLSDQSARSQVLGDGSKQSGGRRQEVPSTMGLPKVMDEFLQELDHSYAITYSLPDGVKPSNHFELKLKRKDSVLRAPTRIPE
jgi:VWFA-related protein